MKKTNLRKLLLVGVLAIGSLGFSAVASAAITQDQAKAIVMKEVPNGQITKMELDYDHGRQVYEIEVMDGNVERDFDRCRNWNNRKNGYGSSSRTQTS